MSGLRRHCVVIVDGEKFEVITSARDVADAEKLGIDAQKQPMMYTLAIVHHTLLRSDKPVPHDFYDFIDKLDDFEDLEGDQTPDPTHAAP